MNIEPPDWISEDAKDIFLATVELMGRAAVESDASLIADFAEAQSDVIRLTAVVRFEGDTVKSEKGISYMNPTLTVLTSRRNALERLRHDLKLTPRARQAVPTKAGKSSVRASLES